MKKQILTGVMTALTISISWVSGASAIQLPASSDGSVPESFGEESFDDSNPGINFGLCNGLAANTTSECPLSDELASSGGAGGSSGSVSGGAAAPSDSSAAPVEIPETQAPSPAETPAAVETETPSTSEPSSPAIPSEAGQENGGSENLNPEEENVNPSAPEGEVLGVMETRDHSEEYLRKIGDLEKQLAEQKAVAGRYAFYPWLTLILFMTDLLLVLLLFWKKKKRDKKLKASPVRKK